MIRRVAITSLLAILGAGLTATSARGMVVYNESESGQPNPVGIYFGCGTGCHNSWKVAVNSSATRPGKAGYLSVTSGNFTGVPREWDCQISDSPRVSEHGWGELHGPTYAWSIFGNDNQEVSGSPFRITLGLFIMQAQACEPFDGGAAGEAGGSQ